mgnify:CR=1 FL=1
MIPAVVLCFVPAKVVTGALNSMPAWLSGGMAVGGGMVAAVGYAMVINMMATKETWPFLRSWFRFSSYLRTYINRIRCYWCCSCFNLSWIKRQCW